MNQSFQQTKVKMCGMMRPEDIKAANAVRPDFVGFIFAENRRRTVSADTAAKLRSALDEGIKAVGVFLDQDADTIVSTANTCGLDYIQLHGSEDETFIEDLRKKTDIPVINVFLAKNEGMTKDANDSSAELVLIDSGAGSGETFAWEILREINRPCFLAGGLSVENAGEAVRNYHPFALDVSSGIETDGYKDPDKMKAFMEAVRKANEEGKI